MVTPSMKKEGLGPLSPLAIKGGVTRMTFTAQILANPERMGVLSGIARELPMVGQ